MKQTKKQEYDEIAKYGEIFEQTNNFGGYCVVIDTNGESALWRDCTSRYEHTAQRWQRIKYTCGRDPETWRPYITIYGRRHYLDNFSRCGY